MKNTKKIIVISIVLGCVFLDVALHVATSSYGTLPRDPEPSIFATILGTEITASLWALFAFSVVAIVFLHIRDVIPGEGVRKGLRYGIAIALLWTMGMLEGVPLFGHSFINEFVVGLSDAIPVFLLGVLLSLLQPGEKTETASVKFSLGKKMQAVLILAGLFLVGRYIAYASGMIRSGIQDMPLQTFVWTLMMGISIGASYVLVGAKLQGSSLKQRAMRFGFLIFGMNWAVFLVFMPLLFSGYIADVLVRIILDAALVAFGTYLIIIPKREFQDTSTKR